MDPKNQWTLCTGKKKKAGKFQTLQLDQPPDTCSTSMRQSQGAKESAWQFKMVEGEDFSTFKLALSDDHCELKEQLQNLGFEGLLDTQLEVLRLVMASATRPPEFIDGKRHVKGLLLYGPPGTGKTHLIRQMGKLLLARELKIAAGAEVLAPGNTCKLFQDAEEEQERLGSNSALHVITFDRIDAISKARGSVLAACGTRTVLDELLSKIDGLGNILMIGTTDRRDFIDEALLRRFGIHLEIGMPDKSRRAQILEKQLAKLMEFNNIASDVDLSELLKWTGNFTAGDIASLVLFAKTEALSRLIKVYPNKVQVDPHFAKKLNVCRSDFLYVLNNDMKLVFQSSPDPDEFTPYISDGIIPWGDPVESFFANGTSLIQKALSERSGSGLFTVLVEGAHKAGKTAIAAQLAKKFDFPFVRICSPENMVGLSQADKCDKFRKDFGDAYYSPLSCIFIDNIEFLIEYREIGSPYSKVILQTLLELLKKPPREGHKLVVLCTTNCGKKLEKMDILPRFNAVLKVPYLSTVEHVTSVLKETKVLTDSEIAEFTKKIGSLRPCIGIKSLLWNISLAKLIGEDSLTKVGRAKKKLNDEDCRVDFLFNKLKSNGFLV